MPTIVIYQINIDPIIGADTTVTASFTVDVTDDDLLLEDPDSDGSEQFDVSGIPGLSSSESFQIFESYEGDIGGDTVTFTLLQFSGGLYVFATAGSIGLGDTIVGPTLVTNPGPSVAYTDLPDYVCFADGTQILTRKEQVNVEDLQVGDQVLTMDNGYQPIRWIGSRTLDRIDLAANPNLRPIRIQAGTFGPGMPEQDLVVSQQHRIFVRSVVAHRMFGAAEVLIPAKKLLDLDCVSIDLEATTVTYTHFLCERHEIVFSNGVPTESMLTGVEALKSVGTAARQEIAALFPEIVSGEVTPCPARPIPPKGKMMQQFARRLQKNNKRVIEEVA